MIGFQQLNENTSEKIYFFSLSQFNDSTFKARKIKEADRDENAEGHITSCVITVC